MEGLQVLRTQFLEGVVMGERRLLAPEARLYWRQGHRIRLGDVVGETGTVSYQKGGFGGGNARI